MLALFKQNSGWQFVILAAVSVLLWAGAFVNPPQMTTPEGFVPLYELCYGALSSHGVAAVGVAFVLTMVEALMLSNLLYNYKMVTQGTVLPSLLFVAAMALSNETMTLTPMLLVNLFILIACDQLMVLGVPSIDTGHAAGAAACISMAALCFCPALLLILPLLVVYSIYKMYSWRDLLALVLGLAAPLIAGGCFYLLSGDIDYAAFRLINDWTSFRILTAPCHWLVLSMDFLLVVLTLVALVSFSNSGDLPTEGRRNGIIMALLLIFGCGVPFFSRLLPLNMQAIAIPFAFLVNNFLMGARKRLWIYNSILVLLIVCAALTQYV